MATWATATTGARVKALQRLLRPRRAQPRRAQPRRVAQRALRRAQPRRRRALRRALRRRLPRAQPRRRRRRLGDNRVAPPAPMTVSALTGPGLSGSSLYDALGRALWAPHWRGFPLGPSPRCVGPRVVLSDLLSQNRRFRDT